MRAPARVVAWVALSLALVAAAGAVAAGLGTRWEWWHFSTGFAVLRRSAQLGLGAGALAVLAGVLAALTRHSGVLVAAALGLAVGLIVAGVPWQMLRQARGLPPIHDITTDPDSPPGFVAVLDRRRDAPNPTEYGGPAIAALQRQAYPDIQPARFAAPPERVFARAETAARKLGWEIVATVPGEGRLEATDTTVWFGFKDDVVVRLTPIASGTRVDARSVSRVGRSDLGANAARIRRFLRALRENGLPPLSPAAGDVRTARS